MALINFPNTNFTIDPDEDLPEYAYIQIILSNIQDFNENIFINDVIQFGTADESPPLILSSNIESTNEKILLTFNEGIFSSDNGTGGVSLEDFNYTFDSNAGNCTSISILSLNSLSGATLIGGETSIYIFLQLEGSPSGVETIILSPVNGSSIYDETGNAMFPSSTTDTLILNSSAIIINQVLSPNNEYVDIIFSSGLYGNSLQSDPITVSDLFVELNSNDGNATSVYLTDVSTILDDELSGGEDTIRTHMIFDNIPSGLETIMIRPSGENTIYNSEGTLIPQSENTGEILLFDRLPPEGTIIGIEDGEINVGKNDAI